MWIVFLCGYKTSLPSTPSNGHKCRSYRAYFRAHTSGDSIPVAFLPRRPRCGGAAAAWTQMPPGTRGSQLRSGGATRPAGVGRRSTVPGTDGLKTWGTSGWSGCRRGTRGLGCWSRWNVTTGGTRIRPESHTGATAWTTKPAGRRRRCHRTRTPPGPGGSWYLVARRMNSVLGMGLGYRALQHITLHYSTVQYITNEQMSDHSYVKNNCNLAFLGT